jgi:hypothetical protein
MITPPPVEENTAYSRGYNCLIARDYSAAVVSIREYYDLNPKVQSTNLAVALWMAGSRDEACVHLEHEIGRLRTREATHTDGAGGVLAPAMLWWASAHVGLSQFRKPALAEIKLRWKTKCAQRSVWPGRIASYILSAVSDEDLLYAAEVAQSAGYQLGPDGGLVMVAGRRSPNATLIAKALTKAKLYIAGRRLHDGDPAACLEWLVSAASHVAAVVDIDWFLARYEVERAGTPR